jgi:diguanylate cyclase (GGDEF)-like protein
MRDVAAPHPVPVAWLSRVRLGGLAAAILVGPAVLLLQSLESGDGVPVLSVGSAVLGLLVLARLALVVGLLNDDVAARRRLEAELSYQASHDPLTGIANRRSFLARLAALDAATGRPPFALLFIDLDDFKTVNDAFGHAGGDEVLAVVARRIEASVRPRDLAARLGGDEFAILLLDADQTRARRVADRILEALAAPIAVREGTVSVRASVGIADSASSGLSAEAMIHDSDVAMYQAKSLGKDRYQVFRAATSAGA